MRLLSCADYDKDYLQLLEVLTNSKETISRENFEYFVKSMNDFHQIWVLEMNNKIVGSVTCIIEPKLIHNGSFVLHVEDVVIHNEYQHQGLGKQMMEKVKEIALRNKCYKIILDCLEKNQKFYESCGFSQKQIQMSLYLG
jgi:glucosamine-phosphate N-acetyltransferase